MLDPTPDQSRRYFEIQRDGYRQKMHGALMGVVILTGLAGLGAQLGQTWLQWSGIIAALACLLSFLDSRRHWKIATAEMIKRPHAAPGMAHKGRERFSGQLRRPRPTSAADGPHSEF